MLHSRSRRKAGWRKLIRMKARQGSDADRHAIEYAVILFNHFTTGTEAPFGVNGTSVNTQVALVTRYPHDVGDPPDSACRSKLDSIYWLDFNATRDGAKLSLKLDNSFDARDLQPSEPGGVPGNVAYFVPEGCDSCHGDPPPRLGRSQLNYLDTDHWYDRARDDFPQVTQAAIPVLTDAGNDVKSPRFTQGFDVVRQLNEEFDRQQRAIATGTFHQASTQTWLKVHERSAEPASLLARAIDPGLVQPGGQGPRWSTGADEAALVGLLSRYCFRCHGSIRFNVMNRTSVLQRRVEIRGRLKPNVEQARTTRFEMPPDRTLPAADRDRMLLLMSRMPRQ